jgi:hypothetical protein
MRGVRVKGNVKYMSSEQSGRTYSSPPWPWQLVNWAGNSCVRVAVNVVAIWYWVVPAKQYLASVSVYRSG